MTSTKVTITVEIFDPGIRVVVYLLAGAHDYIKSNLELHAALKKLEPEKIQILEQTSVSEREVVAQGDSPQGLFTVCVDSIDPTGQSAEEHWGSGFPYTINGDTKSIKVIAPRVRPKSQGPLNRMFHVNPPIPQRAPIVPPPVAAEPIEPSEPIKPAKPWWRFWR